MSSSQRLLRKATYTFQPGHGGELVAFLLTIISEKWDVQMRAFFPFKNALYHWPQRMFNRHCVISPPQTISLCCPNQAFSMLFILYSEVLHTCVQLLLIQLKLSMACLFLKRGTARFALRYPTLRYPTLACGETTESAVHQRTVLPRMSLTSHLYWNSAR